MAGADDRHDLWSAYSAAASGLVARFEAISPVTLYHPVIDLLPTSPSRILDIGAGTGRDAAWLADMGHEVHAVEPADALRQAAIALHASSPVIWLADSLPELTKVTGRFERVLLSAVWQHLCGAERAASIRRLRQLAAAGGIVIMSIRHGPGAPERPVHEADIEGTIRSAVREGFVLIRQRHAESLQDANRRSGVSWTWLAFGLP